MKNYLRNWGLMRAVRLGLGIIIAAQGIQANEWILAALGGAFALMSLLNVGCCGASGCNTYTYTPKNRRETQDITYEEVKTK